MVDCLRVAICSTLVRCYWCISILIIIPTVRCCSLIAPLCSDRLLCFLIVGIQASGISIPLSLLRCKRKQMCYKKKFRNAPAVTIINLAAPACRGDLTEVMRIVHREVAHCHQAKTLAIGVTLESRLIKFYIEHLMKR